jgi:2-(1,2-epoxy-1,2-dihydrophenyl)acetyl-CoA isomerase
VTKRAHGTASATTSTTPAEPTILLARDGPIATLTLNRPAALNVLDLSMMDAFVANAAALASDTTLRVVVLRGAGRHFMAGGDLRTFASRLDDVHASARREEFQRIVERLHAGIEHLHRMPHALIGAVQGAVAGFGMSLAAACDLVIATDDAYFSSAYRQIGLSPDGGGTWSLPRIVGMRKALELYLLSERFDAQEALRIGLVNRVVDRSLLDAAVDQWARSIATGPRAALRNVRRLLRDSPGRSLSEQLRAEAESFGQCAASPDFEEGLRAFFDKRPARFEP